MICYASVQLQKKIHDLVRLSYECALDPLQWPLFLELYAGTIGAASAALIVHDHNNQRGNVNINVGIDPYWEAKYSEYYSAINTWIVRGHEHLIPGQAVKAEAAVPSEELVKTEFYNDFLLPQEHFYSMGGAILKDATGFSGLMAIRRKKAGTFTGEGQEILGALLPHLQISMRIHQRIATIEGSLTQAHYALDEMRNGIILTDPKGKVLFANWRASEALREHDGIWLGREGLHASTPQESERLRELIAEAVRPLPFSFRRWIGILLRTRCCSKNCWILHPRKRALRLLWSREKACRSIPMKLAWR